MCTLESLEPKEAVFMEVRVVADLAKLQVLEVQVAVQNLAELSIRLSVVRRRGHCHW